MKSKSIGIAALLALTGLIVLWMVVQLRVTAEDDTFTIICMGDSLTESEFGYYPKHLAGMLKRRGVDARVVTAARPGHTSGEYLRYLEHSGILEETRPDLAIVMLGTNDVRVDRDHTPLSRYRRNMDRIISRIRKAGKERPFIFLASIPPIFKIDLHTFDRTSRERVESEIVPAIRDLARQEDIQFIDIHAFFRKRPELMAGIHPWKRGYFAMADYIFNSILPFLEVE